MRMVTASTSRELSSVSVPLALKSAQMEPNVLTTVRKNVTRHMSGASFKTLCFKRWLFGDVVMSNIFSCRVNSYKNRIYSSRELDY